jgi:hypothetical protein
MPPIGKPLTLAGKPLLAPVCRVQQRDDHQGLHAPDDHREAEYDPRGAVEVGIDQPVAQRADRRACGGQPGDGERQRTLEAQSRKRPM